MRSSERPSVLAALPRLAAVAAWVALSAAPAGAQSAGAAVYSTIRDQGWAQVVIALRQVSAPPTDVARLSGAIATERTRVLSELTEDDFVPTHVYSTLSAVAGRLSRSGLNKLLVDPDVLRIDVDVPGRISTAESSPLIRARDVHSAGFRGGGIVVAVLDTGVDTDHPDLADSIIDQQCFCTTSSGGGCCPGGGTSASGAGAAEDDQGHGTNVAGIITGNGNSAPEGIAPDAQILPIKVLDSSGGASGTAQVLSAFDYIMTSHPEVKVVNLSLVFNPLAGTCDNAASFTMSFAQAINALKARGTVTVASSGNNGLSNMIGVPACITSTLAVGAVYDGNVGSITFGCTDASTSTDQATCFSNSSSAVDVMAPGAAITSSGMGGGSVTFMGTSQAAPHVAAAAALLFQAKPSLSVDQLVSALRGSGVPITDPKSGLTIPRIDVQAALDSAP